MGKKISAYIVGFRTGWSQYQDLSVTRHYEDENILEIHDRGTILGQKLRNPFDNQSKREGYKVFRRG